MKSYKQFREGLRAVGKPVQSLSQMDKDFDIIDADPNPLSRKLKSIRYRKYLNAFGVVNKEV